MRGVRVRCENTYLCQSLKHLGLFSQVETLLWVDAAQPVESSCPEDRVNEAKSPAKMSFLLIMVN